MRQHNNTHLPTALTHVRLLARVNTRMDSQSGTLNELLATPWMLADVRPYTAVDSLCLGISKQDLDFLVSTHHDEQDRFCAQTLCHKSNKQTPLVVYQARSS